MKGVSPLISVALLLGVAISIAGVYAEWAPGFAENITQGAADRSNEDLKCSNAGLSIREPTYDNTGNLIDFEVENSGTIRFTGDIKVVAFNSSLPVNNTSFRGLEVGESRPTSIYSDPKPDLLIASSQVCPSVKDVERLIEVSE